MIATNGGPAAAFAAKAATTTIPIVFSVAEDPVRLGLVASLARPGGNATGVNILVAELEGKRLGLLRELSSTSGAIAVLGTAAREHLRARQRPDRAFAVHSRGATPRRAPNDPLATPGRNRGVVVVEILATFPC